MTNIQNKAQELLTQHGLDFLIEKDDYQRNGISTSYFGLFNSKTGECINTVKKGYTISQNVDIVEGVLKGMEKFGDKITVSKAGSLNGGRRIYMQLGIEGDGKVNGDVIKRYVTIIDSNDGGLSLSVGIGDKTMSCENQFAKFYKAGNAKFRHTATIEEKMKNIPSLIELALSESLKQVELYNRLESTPITKGLADAMVKHVLGYDRKLTSMEIMATKSTRSINIMENLYNRIEEEISGKGLNLWGLHSGVTSFTTHDKSRPKRENGDMESILGGGAYKMNQDSLRFATSKLLELELA